MRRFNSGFRGAAPGPLVIAVDMCIVPIATFGSDVWWPGLKRPTQCGTVTSSTTNLCSMIDRANLMGLRAALPMMRTTPNAIIQREGGIPPEKVILEGNRLRLSARLKSLDDQHPLRARDAVCPNVGTRKYKKTAKPSARPEIQMSRVQRAYREVPETESPEPLPPPVYPIKSVTKQVEREASARWIDNMPRSEICAYSDGSSEGHGRSAWGFVLKRDGRLIGKGSGIKHGGEVLDAEIIGARKALKAALEFMEEEQRRKGGGLQRVHVLLDSQQAVSALLTGFSSTSLEDVRSFRALSEKAQVLVKWVPGNSGIQGNEEADAAGRSALRELPSPETQPESISLAYLRRLTNQRRQALLDDWWKEACPPRYRELALSRRLLRELIAARTGHGNFAAYHRRFNNAHAPMECTCGRRLLQPTSSTVDSTVITRVDSGSQ